MHATAVSLMSEAEYLEYDLVQEGKHEFVNGEVIAMSGVSPAHDTILGSVFIALGTRLRGTPCRPHTSDLRVRIDETGMYAYPDLTIHCGKAEYAPTRPESLLNPRVIIEVLSESTADYDLGAKANHYRPRPTVEALLFIDSRRRWVQLQTRNPDGTWLLSVLEQGTVALAAVDVSLPFDEIYEGVDELV